MRAAPSSGQCDERTAMPGSFSPEGGPEAARSVNDTSSANNPAPARWGSCRFSTSLPSPLRRGVSERIASSVARISAKSAVPPESGGTAAASIP